MGSISLIQSSFGLIGNFELVALVSSGGLFHEWRNNDPPPPPFGVYPWTSSANFDSVGQISAVSLIQSSYGGGLNLEVVGLASATGELWHFWRDGDGWHRDDKPFASGILSSPVTTFPGSVSFIQGKFGGAIGNFELVAPLATGGFGHWWRDNNDPNLPWKMSAQVGQHLEISAVSLIQSSYGGGLNLEVVVNSGGIGQLTHFWRDGDGWHRDFSGPFASGIWEGAAGFPPGSISFIQGTFGPGPNFNFELVAPLGTGGFGHWWRDNNDPNLPWRMSAQVGQELGLLSAVSLIQSNFANLLPHLEVVVLTGAVGDPRGQLWHFWRDGSLVWYRDNEPINTIF